MARHTTDDRSIRPRPRPATAWRLRALELELGLRQACERAAVDESEIYGPSLLRPARS